MQAYTHHCKFTHQHPFFVCRARILILMMFAAGPKCTPFPRCERNQCMQGTGICPQPAMTHPPHPHSPISPTQHAHRPIPLCKSMSALYQCMSEHCMSEHNIPIVPNHTLSSKQIVSPPVKPLQIPASQSSFRINHDAPAFVLSHRFSDRYIRDAVRGSKNTGFQVLHRVGWHWNF